MTQTSSPLISVIIRSCNRPKLLEKAIASVQAQQYPNTEIVIINEGKNSLAEIAQNARQQVQNVVLVEEDLAQPRGRAAAAQLGIDSSNGQYLNFLDDDDWLYPNHFSTLLRALENSPSLAVYSSIDCVYEGKEDTVVLTYREPYDHNKLFLSNYIPIHSVLFDRVVLKHGVHFAAELAIYEDWDFWLQIAQHTRLLHVDTVTAVYRISPSGSGAHSDSQLQIQHREALWKKWSKALPQSLLFNLFNTTLQHDEFVKAQQQEMAGHRQHLQNYEQQVNEKSAALIALENHKDAEIVAIENEKNEAIKKNAALTIEVEKNNVLLSQQQALNTLRDNQTRINQKINYALISIAGVGAVSLLVLISQLLT